jgi:hydrogenase-4 component F
MVVDASIGVAFMQNLFIFFGALAIVVAALIILTQKKLRRLLAYHSIEHAGIIIIGFGFGGIAAFGALLHMLYYTTAKAILFFGAGIAQMKYRTHRVEYIKDMINILPVTSVTFAIGALALIGLPPFGLFTSEIYIFGSGFSTHPVVAIIGILGVALVFIGMLYKLHLILFGEAVTNPRLTSALGEELHGTTLRDRIKGEFSSWTTVPVVVLVIILIITGVTMPTQLVQLLSGAAGIIQ